MPTSYVKKGKRMHPPTPIAWAQLMPEPEDESEPWDVHWDVPFEVEQAVLKVFKTKGNSSRKYRFPHDTPDKPMLDREDMLMRTLTAAGYKRRPENKGVFYHEEWGEDLNLNEGIEVKDLPPPVILFLYNTLVHPQLMQQFVANKSQHMKKSMLSTERQLEEIRKKREALRTQMLSQLSPPPTARNASRSVSSPRSGPRSSPRSNPRSSPRSSPRSTRSHRTPSRSPRSRSRSPSWSW